MTKRTPASLAEHIALYHPTLPLMTPAQELVFKLDFCREHSTFYAEQVKLLVHELLHGLRAASGATVSADAFKKEPVLPNASARSSVHCTCSTDSDASYTHSDFCPLFRSVPERSEATGTELAMKADKTTRGDALFAQLQRDAWRSGATEEHVSQKRASADADRHPPSTICTPSFCLRGWRGGTQCGQYCAEGYNASDAEAAEGATVGRDCSTSKAGATLSDNKPPVVIIITPTDLCDDDRITLYQLKARADAAYARDQITHGRDGYNL